jgi:hypothetical protein
MWLDVTCIMASTTSPSGATIKCSGGWAVQTYGSPAIMGATTLLSSGTNGTAPPVGWNCTIALDVGSHNALVVVTGDSSLTVDIAVQAEWRYVQ